MSSGTEPGAVHLDTGPPQTPRPNSTITVNWIAPEELDLASGYRVRLVQWLDPLGKMNLRIGFDQEIVLEIQASSLHPLPDFIDILSDFQDLVTIAVGRPAEVAEFVVMHPDAPVRFLSGETHPTERQDLAVHSRWNALDAADEPADWLLMFFNLREFGGMPTVQRWLEISGVYRSELGRVMGVRYRRELSLAERIVNYTAALESLDRRRAPSKIKDLKVRLRRLSLLCDPYFAPGIVGDLEPWLDAVAHYRDNAAHHRGRELGHTSLQHHFIAESLYWLFVLVMLRLSDTPEGAFRSILRHNDLYFLRDGLDQVFPPLSPRPDRFAANDHPIGDGQVEPG